ncbi:MAG: peptide chain release factor N(5)-glutamine methyltransferase [Gemmatimonadaceae bacterium]
MGADEERRAGSANGDAGRWTLGSNGNAVGSVRSVGALVETCQAILTDAAIEEPRRGATDIVTSLFDVPRSWATQHASDPVGDLEWKRATDAARRRATGMPLQYAVGRAAFRHLTLDVDPRVLIPRPETELLVELALDTLGRGARGGIAVDVGTGSGAIALALASEGHFDRVIATDLSRDALAVAARNVTLHRAVLRAVVELRHGSLLAPLRATGTRAALVVSNPPYIAFGEAGALPAAVRDWEPAVALFSGDDGMRDTARLVREAAEVLEPGGVLALEVDARRASLAAECVAATARFGDVRVVLDLAGRERFVAAKRLRTS